jgi:hypothetical protein
VKPVPVPFNDKWVIAKPAEKSGSTNQFWCDDFGWDLNPKLAIRFVFLEDAQDYIRANLPKMGLDYSGRLYRQRR